MRCDFCLEHTFNWYLNEFKESRMLKAFPTVKREIESYSEILANSSEREDRRSSNQIFGIQIATGIKQDYYHLNWRIDDPEEYKQKPITIPTDIDGLHSTIDSVDMEKVKTYMGVKIHKPIIIASCPPIGKYIIIDGNHRFHASRRDGNDVKAIILTPNEHINYLVSERMKTLYKVHHNLFELYNLCKFPVSNFSFATNQTLDFKTYYPFKQQMVFGRLPKLAFILGRLLKLPSFSS